MGLPFTDHVVCPWNNETGTLCSECSKQSVVEIASDEAIRDEINDLPLPTNPNSMSTKSIIDMDGEYSGSPMLTQMVESDELGNMELNHDNETSVTTSHRNFESIPRHPEQIQDQQSSDFRYGDGADSELKAKVKELCTDEKIRPILEKVLRTETRSLRTWTAKSWHNRFNTCEYPMPTVLSFMSRRPGTYVIYRWTKSPVRNGRASKNLRLTKSKSTEIANNNCPRGSSTNCRLHRDLKGRSSDRAQAQENQNVVSSNWRSTPSSPAAFLRSLKAKQRTVDNLNLQERIRNMKPSEQIAKAFATERLLN